MYKNRGESKRLDIAFVSTYYPDRCGIATFTQNLRKAIIKADSTAIARVVAIDQENHYNYVSLPEVYLRIPRDEHRAYTALAEMINRSTIDLVCLQHEFGIFGGDNGSYIMDFVERCEKPIVTTLHTLDEDLSMSARECVGQIVDNSDAVVVLLPICRDKLRRICGKRCDSKVEFMPHGVPEVEWSDKVAAKTRLGLNGRTVLVSFGLLTPNKGLEYAIESLPTIVDRHKDAIYLILGQTHPSVLSQNGEAYRRHLEERVEKLGLRDRVKFVNDFLSEDRLSSYLAASDICLTPYLSPGKTSSGCIVYALAHGAAVVSTSFPHSEYELTETDGLLVPSCDSVAIAEAVNRILEEPSRLTHLQRTALERMKSRAWPRVAERYIGLFKKVLRDEGQMKAQLPPLTNVPLSLE